MRTINTDYHMWNLSSRSLFHLVMVALLIIGATACQSSYDKLLTSPDYKLKLSKALEYYQSEDFYKAQTLFEQVMPFYRGTPQIDTIYFKYAYTHYEMKNFILASYYFKNFTETFTSSPFVEEAAYMTAYSNYRLSPEARLDQTYSIKAMEGFQQFVNRYPSSGKVATCNALIDEIRAKQEEKAIANAELYYKLDNYQSADHAYRNLLKDYPDSKDTELIRFRIVQASYKLAENTIEIKQAERYETVIENCNEFKRRHPESKYANEVEGILKSAQNKLQRLIRS